MVFFLLIHQCEDMLTLDMSEQLLHDRFSIAVSLFLYYYFFPFHRLTFQVPIDIANQSRRQFVVLVSRLTHIAVRQDRER